MAVPGEVAPALTLVAAVAMLEGYRQLDVVPAGQWQLSAILFAALALAAVAVLVRPRKDGRHVVAARMVVLSSVTLLVLSSLTSVVKGDPTTRALGVADLLFAAVVLGTVVANERISRRTP